MEVWKYAYPVPEYDSFTALGSLHLPGHPVTAAKLSTPIKKKTQYRFKVCKSVHHRKVQINYQPDATILQFIILTFIYRSTCFGRFPAHHQDFNDCSSSLWFYLRIVVTVALCSWSGRPDHEHSTTVTTIRK